MDMKYSATLWEVLEYPPINRQIKNEERRALKVKKHSELLKLKMGGIQSPLCPGKPLYGHL
jgi:hypothetical protein